MNWLEEIGEQQQQEESAAPEQEEQSAEEQQQEAEASEEQEESTDESLTQKFINKARGQTKGVKVGGISNTLISVAKCCNPIPGDEIVGYITKGRGVSVHRATCSNIPILENENRFIDVEWNVGSDSSFVVRLNISAIDRKHLLKDVSEKVSSMNIYIQSKNRKNTHND